MNVVRSVWVASLAALLVTFVWAKDNGPLQDWGSITKFHLEVPLRFPQPAPSLTSIDFKNFPLVLYPTDSSGAGGAVPGNTVKGLPLRVPLQQGRYDGTDPDAGSIEFDLIKSQVVSLPKAPGHALALVYGVLYSGYQRANCTGIVEVLALRNGQLVLTDQVSYDCRGGGVATWNARKHRLKIQSARFAAGDPKCCPSLFDRVQFKMDGEKMKPTNVQLEQQ